MKLVEDTVSLPNGKTIEYIREEPSTNFSVAIIAINHKNKILLQKEYSYPPNEVMYQLPGGASEKDEDVIDAANRELSEESGYIGNECRVIGSFYINNRRSDRKQFVVLCKNLVKQKQLEDDEEFIENEWLTQEEIKTLVRDQKIKNVNLLAALSLLAAEKTIS